jgi:hypothetical protein
MQREKILERPYGYERVLQKLGKILFFFMLCGRGPALSSGKAVMALHKHSPILLVKGVDSLSRAA